MLDLVEMQNALWADVRATGAVLQQYPRNAIGLVSDEIRVSPAYRAAKSAADAAFARLRSFNGRFAKALRRSAR